MENNIRIKFRVTQKKEHKIVGMDITLVPIGNEEDANSSITTGFIELTHVPKVIAEIFEIDKEFYVDFTPA